MERLWYIPGLILGDTYSLRRMAETVLWSMAILWGLLWMDFRVDLHLVVLYCLLVGKLGTRRSRYITGETNDQGYLQRWVKSSEADSPVSPWSLGGKHVLIKTIGQQCRAEVQYTPLLGKSIDVHCIYRDSIEDGTILVMCVPAYLYFIAIA